MERKLKVVFTQKAGVKNVMVWRKKETEKKSPVVWKISGERKLNPNVTIKKERRKKKTMNERYLLSVFIMQVSPIPLQRTGRIFLHISKQIGCFVFF